MEKKFPDRQTNRMRWFDYSSSHMYVVTICTYKMQHFFGEVRAEYMWINLPGEITRHQWFSLPKNYPGIWLDQYIAMPNHIHGIIGIYNKTNIERLPKRFQAYMKKMAEEKQIGLSDYQAPRLGEIIRFYKATSTRLIRQAGYSDFAWHTNYDEFIIQDMSSLYNVRRYIYENPQRWSKDKYYSKVPEQK